jgi:hypothetical protein
LAVLKFFDYNPFSNIGASGYCNIDVACTDWANSVAERSVTKLLFTEGQFTYECTGTALNDLDPTTQIPYLITSGHCISTQEVAANLVTYWNFQKSSCYGTNLPKFDQLTGGAEFLYNVSSTDSTLLRLYQDPPSGTMLAGWTTAPVDHGSEVAGIHHPMGDLKKISFGICKGFLDCPGGDLFLCSWGNGEYIAVQWYRGVTEPGSSGSAIFDDQGYVVGTLRGGSSSCQYPYALDCYGRFDLTYPLVKQWLGEVKAIITVPQPCSMLNDSSATFEWTDVGAPLYWLSIGTRGAGSIDIYHQSQGTNTSTTVTGLPTDGRPIYVRLYSWQPCTYSWITKDYTYNF